MAPYGTNTGTVRRVPSPRTHMWAGFVELIRMTIFAAAHLCAGSLGAGILFVSVPVRLALLSLALRVSTAMGLSGLLPPLPSLVGLLSAVRSGLGARIRFLWIADLARPDALLLLAVAAITAGSMTMMPSTQAPNAAPSAQLVLLL